MKKAHLVLSFCAGALAVAALVAVWPVIPTHNEHHLVALTNTTKADHVRCNVLAATAGRRLAGPWDESGNQTTCLLDVYGELDSSGTLVLARELRNPFDVELITRTSVYGSIQKANILQVCPNSGRGTTCPGFNKWMSAQYGLRP